MSANRSHRCGAFAVTLLLVIVAAVPALALDKEDLLRLHEAGLDAGTIVNVIRGTTEELEVTPADVDELEAAGMPAPVIAELRLRLGVDSGQPSGPTLQEELEEQQRLEAERLRLEQERNDAERERLRQEIQDQQSREESVQSAFAGLRGAQRMADDGDYMGAAAAYNRFLEENRPAAGTLEWYEATFGLVDALHRAGMRSAIRAETLELALLGADWDHFAEVVRILRDVVNDSGFASPRIADLSNEVVDPLGDAFADEFNYFMGHYYYEAGDYDQALNHLAAISPSGEYGARSSFLSGVIRISPERGENVAAVRAFEDAITTADAERETDREVLENAYLALARVAYQVGNFGGALFYYSQIPPESQRQTTALFEGGWTYFLSGDLNRALGSFHSLHSPYHDHRFFPDLFVLEAAAYLYSCNIDEAHDAIGAFEEEIGPLREQVQAILAEVSDPQVFFDAVMDPEGSRQAGNPSLPEPVVAVILADADFYNLYRVVNQLESEINRLRAAGASLGERGESGLASLEIERSNKTVELGLLTRDIIYNLSQELDDWWFRAQEVEIEITDLEASYLQALLSQGEEAITEGSTLFVVADDWEYWPWEGEYWLDEVGNYRGNLTTRCPDDVEF